MTDHSGPPDPSDGPSDDAIRSALGHDPARSPDVDRIADIRRLATERRVAAQVPPPPVSLEAAVQRRKGRTGDRRQLLLAAAAAVGALVGTTATLAATNRSGNDDESAEQAAATETIAFTTPSGAVSSTISRSEMIDHSWGGELVIDIAGLKAGETYDVTYAATDGRVEAAGSFRSVPDVVMKCRFNASLLRAETDRIDITAGSTGDLVATARLA